MVIGAAARLRHEGTTAHPSGVDAHGQGLGRALIDDLFARTGANRIDTLAEVDAAGFYESLPHKTKPGFRLYPDR